MTRLSEFMIAMIVLITAITVSMQISGRIDHARAARAVPVIAPMLTAEVADEPKSIQEMIDDHYLTEWHSLELEYRAALDLQQGMTMQLMRLMASTESNVPAALSQIHDFDVYVQQISLGLPPELRASAPEQFPGSGMGCDQL